MWTLLQLTELFVGLMAILLIGRYWSWPGSRHKDMPPDLNNKYGPLVSLKVGVGNMIVIGGDGSLVRHLLDKRGAIYSNRPLQMSTEIAGKGDDSSKWRLARKQIVQHYASSVVKTEYVGLQEAESVQLLHDFLHDPKHFMQHPMRFTTSVVTCLSMCLPWAFFVLVTSMVRKFLSLYCYLDYGVRCETYEDPAVRTIEEIMVRVCDLLMPGSKPPVEDFPWLRFIPDFVSDWKARSRNIGDLMDKLYGAWTRGASGLNRGTLSYKLRANEANSGLSRHFQAYIAGLVLEGGSDIVCSLVHFTRREKLMPLPFSGRRSNLDMHINDTSSQERARKEIDALYDEDTLPRWVDEQAMPFVRAVIKEVLRWRPPLPIAIPHRLEQEIISSYQQMTIMKGTSTPKIQQVNCPEACEVSIKGTSAYGIDIPVICNIWAIHSNPERFDDPKVFRPERFLDYKMSMAESIAQGDPFERDHFAFGAGRRSCPGVQVAEQDIFIALSRLLWAFEFSAPTGTQVNVEQCAFTGETVRHPKEFPLVIKPRSERRKATIEREMAHAKEHVFSQYGVYKPE
ncbi:cytochrome P450, putative [Rhizoctonia solani AG-1 IA]|uniref:Cytochrome P450, putative n=1 Tax=Thanatephorus cucumeris (strain AG1-IA) TaxID=983506 RepID=L8WIS2_THACA|nr:cytochrome P450, putative [Rhizoctonia solani AG-1 IA]